MKHFIIVKFKKEINASQLSEPVTALFSGLTELEGIHSVVIRTSCIDRPNRYDIMIEINMDKDALERYDHSDVHIKWKQEYSDMIESKAIFDCE
ncbi:MAG: Dabb family protein [Huintestinicola sp.]